MNREQRRAVARSVVKRGAVRGHVVRSARRDVAAALKGVGPKLQEQEQDRRLKDLGLVKAVKKIWTPGDR